MLRNITVKNLEKLNACQEGIEYFERLGIKSIPASEYVLSEKYRYVDWVMDNFKIKKETLKSWGDIQRAGFAGELRKT